MFTAEKEPRGRAVMRRRSNAPKGKTFRAAEDAARIGYWKD